ncbi:MAG: carboxymuconolactone decarboxylase family protein [Planctomycetales bacterium]|jgi:4-carboxymuconolactone decarboxylase
MSSDYEKGRKQFSEMVGEDAIDDLLAKFGKVYPDFETEVVSVVGGRVWTRGGIDLKTRSLCSICTLAALGRTNALRLNFRMALKNGASIEEICESLFQVAAYAGYPAMWDALEILGGVLDCEQTSREENA